MSMFKSKKPKKGKQQPTLHFANTPQNDEHLSSSYVDDSILGNNAGSRKSKSKNNNSATSTAGNNLNNSNNHQGQQQGNSSKGGLNSNSSQVEDNFNKLNVAENNNIYPPSGEFELDNETSNPEIVPPPPMDETEAILLRLHSSLIDFYSKHKKENVDEDVLTILMQFFIDAGGVALNQKLMDKYGEDLNTFTPLGEDEPPPPPLEYQQTLDRAKRHSLATELGIELPPAQKQETTVKPDRPIKPRSSRNLSNGATSATKKRKIKNKELEKFKADKVQETLERAKKAEKEIDEVLGLNLNEETGKKLEALDEPSTEELSPRDLIEAFYSKHDESKLEKDTGIEKFVMWVEQHSIEGLSDKLKGKYREGLLDPSIKKLARRRRNLEDALTSFYLKHDRAKLETRWTIMKILNWTMINGVVALNRKFVTRYGLPVIQV